MNVFKKIILFIKNLFSHKSTNNQDLLGFNSYLLNTSRIYNCTNEISQSILWRANSDLNKPLLDITDKPSKFVEDTHHYVSLATYYWPNPDTQDGMPYIVKDGYINPEVKEYDLYKIQELSYRLRHYMMAYILTKNDQYYQIFLNQIVRWFIDKNTYMYPKFEYCQIGPGTNNNKGINTFESYFLINILEYITIMNSITPFDPELVNNLKIWIKDLVKYIETSKPGQFENNMRNNHSIMYDVGLIYFKILSTGKLDTNIVNRFYKRITKQILEDGSQPEELKRNQGFKYSVYNLEHIIDGIKIIQNTQNTIPENILNLVNKAFVFLKQFNSQEEFNSKYQEIGNWNQCYDYYLQQAARLNIEKYDFNINKDFLTF